MIPGIRKQLRFAFRYSPAAVRKERIDDALAQAFVLFAHLVLRKRVRLAHPTALARYAAHRVRSQRPIGSRSNSRDVMSPVTQRRFGFRVISADPGCWAGHLRPTELLGESRQATPAELAAIRVDFASWLGRLSGRQREIALCLAVGESTGAVAQRFGVSCGRISQIRLELATRWRQFHGELPEREQLASRLSGGRPPGAGLDASPPGDAKMAPIAGQALPAAAARGRASDSPDSDWSQTDARRHTSLQTVVAAAH
ncbi:MAG TPA: hypothetical protein VG055_11565 [Planctomycetaceae bacterium]|nr:hypothetical protein [Planctomycetaceae bacterium]